MYDIRYICRIGCVFCINIQVWGYGFASDKVFCAPLLGVFVVFLIVFSFFSCLSVGLGDGFQGDCNRMGRRFFLFRLTVLCPVDMGIRFCRGGFVRFVPYRRSHKQPMKILLCLPGSRDVAGWGACGGGCGRSYVHGGGLSTALFRWMPDRFPFSVRAVFLSVVRRFPSVFGLPCPVFSSG